MLLGVLAFIVAASIDAVQRKGDRPDAVRLTHAGQIAGAIGLDMWTWFVPDAPRPPIHVSLLDIGDNSGFLTIMFPLCSILPLLPNDFWSGTSGKPGEVSLTV